MSLLRPHRGDKHKGPKAKPRLSEQERKERARAACRAWREKQGVRYKARRRAQNRVYWAANAKELNARRRAKKLALMRNA